MPAAPSVGRRLVARGRAGVEIELRDARDRFVASDPGLYRLRHGVRALVSVGTTVGVQVLIARAFGVAGRTLLLHVMIGGVIAMNMATSVRERRRSEALKTSAGAPVAAALGAAVATLIVPVHWLALSLFVVISFAAVWVRPFGPRWFTLGFITWQAYFFATFLKAPLSSLPGLLVAVVVSTTWVTLLLLTVLHVEPEATLRRTVTSLRARARAVISAAIDVLDSGGSVRSLRRLRAQLVKTSGVALLLDGQLSDERALPEGVGPGRLRRWIVDLEIGVDEVAGAVVDLAALGADDPGAPSARTRSAVRSTLEALGWSQLPEARSAAEALLRPPHRAYPAVRRLANGARLLVASVADWLGGSLLTAADGPDLGHTEEGPELTYEPVVTLVGGNLPGSAAVAGRAVARDVEHRWSPGRLRFTTRQAIQAATAAAIAVGLGQLISPQRFYWAVLAAFITFTGAVTAAETIRKALGRTFGTLLGLVAAVGLSQVTIGRPLLAFAALLGCVFLAFYLQALSNAVMIFFITLMLGELYSLIHTFQDSVLVLRLAETAAGAGAGIIASFLVLPVSTRGTLVAARRQLMEHLALLLDDCAALLVGAPPTSDPLTTVVAMEESSRQVANAQASLLTPRFLDADFAERSRRVAVLGVCAATARAVLQSTLSGVRDAPATQAEVCHVLASEARRLAEVPNLKDQRPARADRPGLSEQVAALLDDADVGGPPTPLARRLQRLADALALLTPRGRR